MSILTFRLALIIALLLGINGMAARAQQTVYDDGLASGWASYSWAAVKLDDTTLVHEGKNAISVTVKEGSYGALELRTAPFDGSKFGAVTFWINGGPTGGQGSLVVKASVDGKQQGMTGIPKLEANKWTQVTVSLADLGVNTSPKVTGFLIQQNSADAAPTFFVDDIQLTAATGAAPKAVETLPVHQGPVNPLPYTGVNIAGGDFGDRKPGVTAIYGKNYIYPQPSELDYFAGKGVNIIRFPFRWPDLQPALKQPLDPAALDRVKSVVAEATKRGLVVILDPHDYARYYDKLIGSPDVPDDAFADFWGRLAGQFKDNPHVWFGLINEPNGIAKEQWLDAANAAIAGIRKAGAKNMILVPGIDWTGAHSWISSGNGEAMLKIADPQNHYIFEVHQYLDSDSSGTKPEVVSATVGSERLQQFTLWCRAHHQRALLGEFGAAANAPAALAADDMLTYMEKNRDVWAGFTWWSAGAWFGDYMFMLGPKDGKDRPQMAFMRPHFQAAKMTAPKP